ncbi:Bacterial inner-membrane translocator, partial [human gut metagenome]
VMTFAISAFFAGIGGGIYAHYMTAMIPTNFNFNYSAELLSEVIIGGTGSLTGSIIGAAFLSALPELMREFSPTACWPTRWFWCWSCCSVPAASLAGGSSA